MRTFMACRETRRFFQSLSFILIYFLFASITNAQDSTSAGSSARIWRVRLDVETGYTSFTLGEARSLFNQILATYRQRDIPLPSQINFPGNMLIGGSIMFYTPIPVSIGIGGYYSKTAAISSYEDYSGTLLERMDVNLATVYMTVQLSPFNDLRSLYICAHPGVGYSQLVYSEQVNMNYPSTQSASTNMAGHGLIIVGDAGVGMNFRLMRFPVAIEADYREGKITQLTDTGGYMQVPLDISGFVFKARIGIGI